jgi:cellulose synthase (UDP-forming)
MNKRKKSCNALTVVSTVMMIIYFGWRLFFTFPVKYGTVAMIAACLLFLCELVSAVEAFIHLITSMNPFIPEKPVIPEEWYPQVDVFIATHNESTDILYKTVNGCKYMKYPDKSKVHIWICDDGNRSEMKELADKMGVGWLGLADNKLAKAGNLNNALSKTSAPLVVTFDADMIPTRNFLLETVPYFFLPKMKKLEDGTWVARREDEIDKNYKIGFIQTPQSFYNPDLFQYNLYATDKIPNEQDYFFREINVSRNKSNSPIYAGSNTVISRQALEEVGGIATGTITEDFETGIHIQGRGYSCYAIDKVVAHGLAPDTVDSLIKQRERWGRGCIYSLRKMHIWKNKEMNLKMKISYFSCKLYWWTFFRRFVFILCPILFAVFSVPVMDCKPWELLVFWLPSYYLFNKAQKMESGNIRTVTWSNVIDTVLFPYLIIPIFLEAIGVKKHQFVVTRKDRIIEDSNDKALAIPHAILFTLSMVALISSLHDLIAYRAVGSIIIIYWLFVNSYALVMAIFFMLGRRNLRMNERYSAELPVKVLFDGNTLYGSSVDISETGMAVRFTDNVVYTPKDTVRIHIKTHHYNAHMDARQVYVSEEVDSETKQKVCRYSFQITDISEKDKAEYYQIIYDRKPSLPEYTENNDSVFGSISDNLSKRIGGVKYAKRHLYRINVNETVRTDEQKDVYMYDYSYQYTVLRRSDTHDAECLKLEPVQGVLLECSLEKKLDEKRALYRIRNGRESLFDERFVTVLNRWIEQDTSL